MKVIGINAAIVSEAGGSIGLGFAIPANGTKENGSTTKGFW